MTEHRVLDDDIREKLRLGSGTPTPPDLADLREGKTVFWGDKDAALRANAIRSTLAYHRQSGRETRKLVTRRAIVEGESGMVAWLEEDKK